MRILSLLLLFAFIIGCGERSEVAAHSHPQRAEIKKAVVEMLTQSTDPFLIVEDPITQNFIQFYNENRRILIDLPEVALTSAETKIAQDYFRKWDIRMKENEDRDPKTGNTFINRSWPETYPPEQIDKVVNLALGALFEIYGISDSTHLTLTKGWK